MTRSGTGGSLERCSRKPIRRGVANATKVSNEGVDNLATAASDVNESGKNLKEIEGNCNTINPGLIKCFNGSCQNSTIIYNYTRQFFHHQLS